MAGAESTQIRRNGRLLAFELPNLLLSDTIKAKATEMRSSGVATVIQAYQAELEREFD
jgi:hypothetical protein